MYKPLVFNWSGGKDSTLALHEILKASKFKVRCLLTTVNEAYNRIAMHGVRESLLMAQAKSLGLPLHIVRLPEMPDMNTYEKAMDLHFGILKEQGVGYAAFGDIFLEDLKKYRESQFERIGLKTIFPLWNRDSLDLVKEFIALGYKTIVVCARADLKDFCGRVIDQSFLDDLPQGVDPCGENGEFHTFVFEGPIFAKPIKFTLGELVFKTVAVENSTDQNLGYWYFDLVPVD
ncbi:diphthine--ammonia ligase [Pedobacter sp. Du54]|uniref:Dph6-related ATP pyrophosphatase n=1 Tax=Pedobacter anseongensis TaxID=3133439 RepID=UPI0030B7AB51